MAERLTGTVTRVLKARGFGFIRADNGDELFMHVEHFRDIAEWDSVRDGLRVSFERGVGLKGPRAIGISLC